MTITEGSAGGDGSPATAGGGIDRLNAFDGLFLRAEHLNRIQDYARELALAVGEAGGPGVVEGYEVSLRDGTLRVGGGLAVTAGGRPLRSRRLVTLPLSGLRPGPDTFWWVEAVPEAWPYGEAPVQGAYCDDPCSGAGTTRRPYTAEGVRIRLTEATERGLDQREPELRRNWLASRLFAAERTEHSPWPYGTAAADLPRSWAPPGTAGKPEAVRLAVLLPHPAGLDAWEADIWAARRDRGAGPPQRQWQARLGMRPWDVFVAQILQFQAHLAQLVEAHAQRTESDLAPLLEQLARIGKQTFLQSHTKDQLGRELAQLVEGIDAGELIASAPVRQEPYSLLRMGIEELPPAGYLPVWGGEGEEGLSLDRVRTWLEPCRDLRWCACAPADVAQAVQEAQHRDRIRLDGSADVDVLVPVDGQGEPLTRWVAFVRRDQRRCREPREEDGRPTARHADGGGAEEPGEARAEPGSGAGPTDPGAAG